jgi:hypothetical protein
MISTEELMTIQILHKQGYVLVNSNRTLSSEKFHS